MGKEKSRLARIHAPTPIEARLLEVLAPATDNGAPDTSDEESAEVAQPDPVPDGNARDKIAA